MAGTGAEIANAYVAITTRAPGIKKDLEKSIGGASSGVEKSGRSLGSSLMKGMKVTALAGAAAVGGAIVGTIGVSLAKGFQRLKGIDNATAKMKGLGFSAEETQGLMDNALESVKGTAFGLEDAAGVAAQMAAGGIGPGKEMADVLSTVANNAAAAGGDLSDMGSVFSKALTQANGVQNDVIGQLADKGIPIYQALADQLGVTSGEVFKMASEGKINFEQFAAAAKDAAGGVAEAMGGTVSGSWDNFMASLGRSGAGLLGGVFEGIAPALQGVTEAMGPLEDVAADLGKKIGDGLSPLLDLLAGVSDFTPPAWMDEISDGFTAMVTAFKDGGDDITSSGFAGLLESIGLAARMLVDTDIMSFLSPLGLAFQMLQPILPMILDSLSQIVVVFGEALSAALSAILPLVVQLLGMFAQLVADVMPLLLPILVQLGEIIGSLFEALAPLMEPLMELVSAIFPILAEVIKGLVPVIQLVVDIIQSVLTPVIDGIVDTLGGLITFLTGVFTGDWEKAWEGIVDVYRGITNLIVGIFEGVINGVIDLINGFLGGISAMGGWLDDITGGVIGFEIGTIPHVNFDSVKLAEGGVVNRSQGGTLATIGEGRYDEAVIPLSPQILSQIGGGGNGGGGVQVDVHPSPGMDEALIGRIAGNEVAYALRG